MAKKEVIVSLTTIKSRIRTIELTLRSLLHQTTPPSRIMLNISREPFMLDSGIDTVDIPAEIRVMIQSGKIELYFVKNIGPYRKLLPTLARLAQDTIVITADDDAVYSPKWIDGLLNAHIANECISAYRCRVMKMKNDRLADYNSWPFVTQVDNSLTYKDILNFPTGRGGILYNTSYFPDFDFLNRLQEVAPGQDDVAFRLSTLMLGIPVVAVDISLSGSEKAEFSGPSVEHELWRSNLAYQNGRSKNDIAIDNVLKVIFEAGYEKILRKYLDIKLL